MLNEADEIIRQDKIDHVYVALPLEEHVKMLGLIEATNREGVDIHVVPDLLQFIALRARLENLDGVPIISLNDVPLRVQQHMKRAIDFRVRRRVMTIAIVCGDCGADQVSPRGRSSTAGAMGLEEGSRLQVRSTVQGAEEETGPIGRDNDRRHAVGKWLRRLDSELAQLGTSSAATVDRGPRTERTNRRQFKHGIAVHAAPPGQGGITGGPGNGWRGKPHSRSGSSTTCITSRTGRSASTSRSCA